MTHVAASTPTRAAARSESDGVLLLGDPSGSWAHGGESATERALRAATDRSDMSDELAWLGRGWPETADTARERGHIVRSLDISGEDRVLEVGAGCGAVTRSLAERAGLVDALELNPDRARLAALRLADRDNARVLCGDVTDIPAEPAYDVIVIIGVLEYIGGHAGAWPRVEWLRTLRGLLREGGHIACAIENRFGVGYLGGGAEDHSGRLFQGIEDHPVAHPSRTFARPELEAIFTNAGLAPTTFGVFPDYRFPRLIFGDELLESPARPLAWRVPQFPTPPHPSHPAARILDERRVWRGLVENGMGMQFANSFLVVAGRDRPQALWPSEQLAVFYTRGRRRALGTQSAVRRSGGEIRVARTRLAPGEPPAAPLAQHVGDAPYVDGEDFLDVLAAADDAQLRDWLGRFVTFLREQLRAADDGAVPFDLWPGNVLVAGGEFVVVDDELAHPSMPSGAVLDRALLLTALELPGRTPPSRWSAKTPRELVAELSALAGVAAVDLDDAVSRQAELAADVFAGEASTPAHAIRRREEVAALNAALDTPLEQTSVHGGARDAGPGLATRLRDAERGRATAEALAADREPLRARLAAAEDALAAARLEAESTAQRLAVAEDALAVIRGSRSWRSTELLRALARRVRG